MYICNNYAFTLYDFLMTLCFFVIQVIPVLLQGLPLKEDMEENETVFKCIVQLITAKNPVVSNTSVGFQHIFTMLITSTIHIHVLVMYMCICVHVVHAPA